MLKPSAKMSVGFAYVLGCSTCGILSFTHGSHSRVTLNYVQGQSVIEIHYTSPYSHAMETFKARAMAATS